MIKNIEVNNLCKYYNDKKAVDNVSFSIYSNEIVGLIGPNGAGKTTILKALTKLTKPTQGDIFIQGINNSNEKENSHLNIGAIIETPDFYPFISGYENLMQVFRIYSNPVEFLDKIVATFGLSERIHDKVSKYSLGMKQRLALCRALISNPSLLILDEPLNGLDVEGVINIRKAMVDFSKEKNHSILISSHDLNELEKICTRFIFINDGKIIKDCSLNQLEDKKKYKIITDTIPKALDILSKNNIEAYQLNNDIIVCILNDDIFNINKKLVLEDIKIWGIEKITHTLEDEYIRIIGKG